MRIHVAIAVLTMGIAAGACANRDEVAQTTGKDEPQSRMSAQDLEQLMQKIGPTFQTIRKHLQANETAEAGKQAQQLAELFGGVEKFWTQHNRSDAMKWAGQARTYASEVAGAAVGGDPAKASAVAENMGGVCKQCHGTYRESDGQGGYRIKPGVVP
jgi:hypothetical protein